MTLGTLANAMTVAKQDGEGLFEPELYRPKASFCSRRRSVRPVPRRSSRVTTEQQASRRPSAAYASARGARRQEAQMLELRSLVSLCRVRRELGDFSHERDELAQVYGAFTEGFETPDLREARVMLQMVTA